MGLRIEFRYRKRQQTTRRFGDWAPPIPSQYLASVAVVAGLKTRVRYHLEAMASLPAENTQYPSNNHASSAEVLAAIGWRITDQFNTKAGGTIEVLNEGLAPEFRLFAGLNYRFGGDTNNPVKPAAEEFEVWPKRINVKTLGQESIQHSGGTRPISYSLEPELGEYDVNTGMYTAPETSGKTTLTLRDRQGRTARAYITVLAQKKKPVPPLTATPEQLTVLTGGAKPVQVAGGNTPWTYRLDPEFGQFDEASMTYMAPAEPGSTTLIISDANSQELRVPITVTAPEAANRTIEISNLNFLRGHGDSDKRGPGTTRIQFRSTEEHSHSPASDCRTHGFKRR